jgi:hypothetical protein
MQQLINALLLYMDQDSCVCEDTSNCPKECTDCMFCTAVTALEAVGYYTQEETPGLTASCAELAESDRS